MTTITVAAAELSRIVKAVERSAARDDARPVLAGIHLAATETTLTATAADGFRLSTAHTTLDDAAETGATAILMALAMLNERSTVIAGRQLGRIARQRVRT